MPDEAIRAHFESDFKLRVESSGILNADEFLVIGRDGYYRRWETQAEWEAFRRGFLIAKEMGGAAGDRPDELIWGVDAIAAEIGRSQRQTYHLLASGALPAVRKVGGHWVVPRQKLWAMFLGDS